MERESPGTRAERNVTAPTDPCPTVPLDVQAFLDARASAAARPEPGRDAPDVIE